MPPASVPLLAAALAASATAAPPLERGVGLGLFASDADYDYGPMLGEIADVGASHVVLVWVWWQRDPRATTIAPIPSWSATEDQVTRTIRQARARGQHVTMFPIVRLSHGAPGEWRGKIAPVDEEAWWSSYGAYVARAAQLARDAGAQRLCVGSELLTRETMRGRWLELIDRVRVSAPDLELMYSANWDHFRVVSFWDAVDVVGMTAYFELTRDPTPSVEALVGAWGPIRADLERWSAEIDRPIVITEVGYPSIDGGAAWPWDETRKAAIDLDEQTAAYRAFVRAWAGAERLRGVYWWNWFGWGGPTDGNYTPRGKPAAGVIRGWYREGR